MSDETKNPAFVSSLQRNNKEIRNDRATAIAEDAMLSYRRAIEDLEHKIRKAKRDREGMLDLSPTNALSLMVANEFDARGFQEKDLELTMAIRNDAIRVTAMRTRYIYLFGEEEPLPPSNVTPDDLIVKEV